MKNIQAKAAFPAGSFATRGVCVLCGRAYPLEEMGYTCPEHHGQPDEGILDIQYDYAAARTRLAPEALSRLSGDMWRYKAVLPLPAQADTPPLAVGWTPLYDAPRLAELLGVARVRVKDDSRQPTGSLKDRASALAVAQARAMGVDTVACASTGNAAAALAGMAAAMGIRCVLFVPASAPEAKVAQLLAFGARVFLVEGTYDDAFEMCMAACRENPWYNRNTGYNPFMCEGKKTVALEIAEQSGWDVPDRVFVGVGDGCIIDAVHKGFHDARRLGLTSGMPRLMGVQAAGSDYLYQAWANGEDPLTKPAIDASTVADSICAGLPRDRLKALRAVADTGGAYLRVEDWEILAAIPLLAGNCGVFAEPAGAAPLAGALAAAKQGLLASDEDICLVVTGSGLKDVPAAISACAESDISATSIARGEAGLKKALEFL